MNRRLVSIVMPAYNAGLYIAKAIESILCQSHVHFELLISDDGSTDDTREIIELFKDSRVRRLHNSRNQGVVRTMNKLLANCTGELITVQDADDWSDVDRLKLQVEAFDRDESLGICGTWAKYFNLKGEVIKEKNTNTNDGAIRQAIEYNNQFCSASIMIRNEVYKKVGGQQDYFNGIGNADYDWSYRIVQNFKAQNIAAHLYNVRMTPGSLSRRIEDPRQLISKKIVHFLAKQREGQDCDSLTGLDPKLLFSYEEELLKPFNRDPALMFRCAADAAAYNKDSMNLRKFSARAFRVSPFQLINLKYLIGAYLPR